MNLVDNKILLDLEINKIIPKIDKTITIYGNKKFLELFNVMYFDISYLNHRRKIIDKIIKLSNNTKKILLELDNIKKCEYSVKWIFDNIDKRFKDFYFTNDFFNTTDILSIRNFFKQYSPIFIVIIYFIIFIILKYNGINIDIKNYFLGIYQGYKMFITNILYILINNIDFISFLTNLLATSYLLYQLYCLYNICDFTLEYYYKSKDFNSHIFNVKKLICHIKKIYKLDKFFETEKKLIISNINKLDNIFKSSKISKFSYCLIIKKNCAKYEKIFDSILQYVGLVDAFIGISKLILDDSFTFPVFNTNKNGPFINALGIKSPFRSINQVKNDLVIGQPNNIILTGPNSSGKSVFITSIMLSILLSQTIGVTYCDYLEFTPFNYLFTYLNIPNISRNNESLFEAEMNRCISYCNILEKLNNNEYTFAIIDELFTGTNPNEGIAASFGVCEYIGNYTNSLNILVTHFFDLTELENSKKFKNMKFSVIKNNDGSPEDDGVA